MTNRTKDAILIGGGYVVAWIVVLLVMKLITYVTYTASYGF